MSQVNTFTAGIRPRRPGLATAGGGAGSVPQAVGEGLANIAKFLETSKEANDRSAALKTEQEFQVGLIEAETVFSEDNSLEAFDRYQEALESNRQNALDSMGKDNRFQKELRQSLELKEARSVASIRTAQAAKIRNASIAQSKSAIDTAGQLMRSGRVEEFTELNESILEDLESNPAYSPSDTIILKDALAASNKAAQVDRAQIVIAQTKGVEDISQVLSQFDQPADRFRAIRNSLDAAANLGEVDRVLELSQALGTGIEDGQVTGFLVQAINMMNSSKSKINIQEYIDQGRVVGKKYQRQVDEFFTSRFPELTTDPNQYQEALETAKRIRRLPTIMVEPFRAIITNENVDFGTAKAVMANMRAINATDPQLLSEHFSQKEIQFMQQFVDTGATEEALVTARAEHFPSTTDKNAALKLRILNEPDNELHIRERFDTTIDPLFRQNVWAFEKTLTVKEQELKKQMFDRYEAIVKGKVINGSNNIEAAIGAALKDVSRGVGESQVYHTGITGVMPEAANSNPSSAMTPQMIKYDVAASFIDNIGLFTNRFGVPYTQWAGDDISNKGRSRDFDTISVMGMFSYAQLPALAAEVVFRKVKRFAANLYQGVSSDLDGQEELSIEMAVGRDRLSQVAAVMERLDGDKTKLRLESQSFQRIESGNQTSPAFHVFVLNAEGEEEKLFVPNPNTGIPEPFVYAPILKGEVLEAKIKTLETLRKTRAAIARQRRMEKEGVTKLPLDVLKMQGIGGLR